MSDDTSCDPKAHYNTNSVELLYLPLRFNIHIDSHIGVNKSEFNELKILVSDRKRSVIFFI